MIWVECVHERNTPKCHCASLLRRFPVPKRTESGVRISFSRSGDRSKRNGRESDGTNSDSDTETDVGWTAPLIFLQIDLSSDTETDTKTDTETDIVWTYFKHCSSCGFLTPEVLFRFSPTYMSDFTSSICPSYQHFHDEVPYELCFSVILSWMVDWPYKSFV